MKAKTIIQNMVERCNISSGTTRIDVWHILSRYYTHFYKLNVTAFLLLGVMITFVLPPFQGPDEFTHWAAGFARMSSEVGPKGEKCSAVYSLEKNLEVNKLPFRTNVKVKTGRYEQIDSFPEHCVLPNRYFISYGNVLTYPNLIIASWFFPKYQTQPREAIKLLYTARILSGLFMVLLLLRLGTQAYKNHHGPTPGLLSAVGFCLTPLFVQQSFIVSSDFIILAATIASATVIVTAQRLQWLDYVVFIFLASIAIITKPVMAPIFLGVCFAPYIIIKLKQQKANDTATQGNSICMNPKLITLSGIIVIGLSFIYFLVVTSKQDITYGTAALANVDKGQQLQFIINHFPTALNALWARIVDAFEVQLWISPLGWLDTPISKVVSIRWWEMLKIYFVIDGLILTAYLWPLRHGIRELKRTIPAVIGVYLAFWLTVLGSALAVTLAAYIYFTSVGSSYVEGVQQRYFFAHAFIFFVGFAWSAYLPRSTFVPREISQRTGRFFKLLYLIFALTFCALAIEIAVTTFLDLKIRYY